MTKASEGLDWDSVREMDWASTKLFDRLASNPTIHDAFHGQLAILNIDRRICGPLLDRRSLVGEMQGMHFV